MASRNSTTDALILTISPQGENNRSVCAVSPEKGIFYATLYGGPKSKMRSLVQPFNRGTMWLYTDESRHSTKISDFDVTNYHPTLGENLYKSWAASLAAELTLRTQCAGDAGQAFRLVSAFIDGLDLCDEKQARAGTIRFLWRYLALLGVQPDVQYCAQCGTPLLTGKNSGSAVECNKTETAVVSPEKAAGKDAVYSASDNGFLCADCARMPHSQISGANTFFPAGSASLTYLAAVSQQQPKISRSMMLDTESEDELRRLVFYLIESACGVKLHTLDTGWGIL